MAGAVWTIVVAGGSGRRFGAAKQFAPIGDERIIDRACRIARRCSDGVVVVLPSTEAVAAWADASDTERPVVGGATRSDSVRAGLAAVPGAADVVCVHDAARPLASPELYARVIAAVRDGAAGAVPGVRVTDTIKIVDTADRVVETPDRASLVAVQTPQAFAADALREAHRGGGEGTDDASLVEARGRTVVVVPGEQWNRKVTEPDDLAWARRWVARSSTEPRSGASA